MDSARSNCIGTNCSLCGMFLLRPAAVKNPACFPCKQERKRKQAAVYALKLREQPSNE